MEEEWGQKKNPYPRPPPPTPSLVLSFSHTHTYVCVHTRVHECVLVYTVQKEGRCETLYNCTRHQTSYTMLTTALITTSLLPISCTILSTPQGREV